MTIKTSKAERVTRHVPPFGTQQFVEPRAELAVHDDGFLLTSPLTLSSPERTVVEYLRASASQWPDRVMLADRVMTDDWRKITYAEAMSQVNSVAQSLLNRGIGKGDVVAIIAPNSIEQAIIMFAALTVGAAVSPISLSYAMFPAARARLVSTYTTAAPKILFVQDANVIAEALADLDLSGAELISAAEATGATTFASLTNEPVTAAVDEAYAAIQPDWIGKLLFTSGSTGNPKAVINTHGMMASNLAMMAMVNLRDRNEHSILLDWLPWHHTFGGNVVLTEAIMVGATFYIDDGKPIPGPMMQRTIDAIKAIKPTVYNCVPAGLGMLADAMDSDPALREAMFSRLSVLRYGGAGLSDTVYQKLQRHCEAVSGQRVPTVTAYAMTEASPAAAILHWPTDSAACAGVPLPGVEMKLVQLGEGRLEIRLRGPSIFPGYLNEPALNAEVFDDEGFFKTGDVCRLLDSENPAAGIAYDGRVSEDFKLETGNWVNVGQIRTELLESFDGLFSDLVITGDRKPFVAAMGWLRSVPDGCETDNGILLPTPALREKLTQKIAAWNEINSASSRRIERLILLAEPACQEKGEVNDKQYINQRAVLKYRADIVERIYADEPLPAAVSADL
ncbi:AMP-binding protein [Alteromonas lipolytica]|uniref:AMP-dependent synthetase/ligase domain-containing protein n=1 Tax=Alteromonas lipolytica TaxID=1856405 RepID=A0A1E8FC67_9ALTE|nr:AMP-binding protein [Alteromonas lipolytica]OFI33505.1 hypothetical protein BFC17_04405 [Alteromonas lipolytica]GGF59071.1 acyl-CoA synthetase [Alteromonas lipolytica]